MALMILLMEERKNNNWVHNSIDYFKKYYLLKLNEKKLLYTMKKYGVQI